MNCLLRSIPFSIQYPLLCVGAPPSVAFRRDGMTPPSAQAGVALGCRLLSGELGMATNDVEFLKESVDQAMSARWGWWRGGGGEDRAQVRAAQQGRISSTHASFSPP